MVHVEKKISVGGWKKSVAPFYASRIVGDKVYTSNYLYR